MRQNLWTAIGTSLIPIAQTYIRYSPLPWGKAFLWHTFSWRRKTYVTRTVFGSRIKGRTGDLVQGFIYYFGIWEPSLTRFIQTRLHGQTGRTFVDVGANVGYFSLLAAECMPSGRVVSIEPAPSIFGMLRENIRLNDYGNVRVVNCAVTATRGDVPIYHGPQHNEGATSLIPAPYRHESVIVEGLPLAQILSDEEVATTRIIKIDVEGAEGSVLEGIWPLISRMPKDVEIVVEVSPSDLGANAVREIFASFEKEGFFTYSLYNSGSSSFHVDLRMEPAGLPIR